MKLKYLFLLLSFPLLFWGCDQSDDVEKIFIGKSWKLVDIMQDRRDPQPVDYWGNGSDREDAWKRSMELKQKAGNYTITLDGWAQDGSINGTFTGYVTSTSVSGTWSANGKDNSFSFSPQSGNDQDVLGNAFIRALGTAYKYSGTDAHLMIYFKDSTLKGYLSFTAVKN